MSANICSGKVSPLYVNDINLSWRRETSSGLIQIKLSLEKGLLVSILLKTNPSLYVGDIKTKNPKNCGDTNRIGLDRIDNSKGHTKDNTVPCCYECNCARNNNFSFEGMKILGKTIKQIKESRKINY